jgi:hypothetical protein
LVVIGVDIDTDYVRSAQIAITESGLDGRVVAKVGDATNMKLDEKVDCVYFSGSFMILPKPVRAAVLTNLAHLVKERGQARVFFTQTFQEPVPVLASLLEVVKPVLKALTTVDFGQVTYWDDFQRDLEEGGLEVERNEVLKGTWWSSQRLVIARFK